MVCPESGLRYREVSPGVIRCLDLDEEAPFETSETSRTLDIAKSNASTFRCANVTAATIERKSIACHTPSRSPC